MKGNGPAEHHRFLSIAVDPNSISGSSRSSRANFRLREKDGNPEPNSPCQNLDFPERRNVGGFDRALSEREDLIGEFSWAPEIGVGSAQRAARIRNKAETIFLFKSARPLGVPAFVIDRRISARLNAAACNKTRLATLLRPRTCSRGPACVDMVASLTWAASRAVRCDWA